MSVQVLVADPYATFRASLQALLNRQSDVEVVDEATTPSELSTKVQAHAPDVLLLEPKIAEVSGVPLAQTTIVRRIIDADLPTRTLVLSGCEEAECVEQMLEQGAYGYLLKRHAPSLLLEAIHGVAQGERGWVSPNLTGNRNEVERSALGEAREKLTAREWEVLIELTNGRSNPEIADRLGITAGTVKSHVHRILQKLDFSSRLKLIVWVHRHGLLHRPEKQPV